MKQADRPSKYITKCDHGFNKKKRKTIHLVSTQKKAFKQHKAVFT